MEKENIIEQVDSLVFRKIKIELKIKEIEKLITDLLKTQRDLKINLRKVTNELSTKLLGRDLKIEVSDESD